MKKLLICSTAIVAAGLIASPASAADKIKLGLGGYMNQWVGVADNDDSYNGTTGAQNIGGFDVQGDSEITFTGSTTLDNGLSVGVKFEMESDGSTNANMDESSLTISSATLGTVTLGAEDAVSSSLHNTAPDVGMGLDDGDFGNWIEIPGNNTAPVATDTNPGANDSYGISYQTPTFSGFTVGATYKPGTGTENPRNVPGTGDDGWSAVVAYGGTFDGISINADVSYGVVNGNDEPGTQTTAYDETGVGLSVGFGGFTVGGAYKNIDQSTNGTSSADGEVWAVGASYATGPAAVSLAYLSGESKGTVATAGDDEKTVLQLSGSYDLGGGVALAGSVFKADYDDETTNAANNNDGWAAVAGVKVSF